MKKLLFLSFWAVSFSVFSFNEVKTAFWSVRDTVSVNVSEEYVTNPDVYPKWDFDEISDGKYYGFNESFRRFLVEEVGQTEAYAHIYIKIDSDGNLKIQDVNTRDEKLLAKLKALPNDFPKFSPALKEGKIVGLEKILTLSFKEKKKRVPTEKDAVPCDVFPKIRNCAIRGSSAASFKQCIDQHVIEIFEYPELAFQNRIQGRVTVVFAITEKGEIEIKESTGGDYILQIEARDILQRLEIETPAMKNGKPVRVFFAYPIVFKLP